MSLSAQDIRDYTRTSLDVESDEVTDDLLNVWMKQGYDKVVGIADNSPTWLHVEYNFDTVEDQQAYDLDTTDGLIDPMPLQAIEDVRGPQWSLDPKSHREMRSLFRQTSPGTARPNRFSLWARSLYLWPIPTSVETIYVTGTRQPIDWITTNTSPDCPEEFHGFIADYVLGRGYAQQDDPEMAASILGSWEQQVTKLLVRWEDGSDAQPFQVNGGSHSSDEYMRYMGVPIFDWL